MKLTRREFYEMFLGAAAVAAVPGCRNCGLFKGGDDGVAETFKKMVDAERMGVCSWSYQKPLKRVAAEMRKLDIHRIHLALQPFLQGDERHGKAEGADARKAVEERFASGEWKLSATMLSFNHEDYTTLETIRATGGIVPDAHWPDVRKLVRQAVDLTAQWKAKYLSLHAGFLDESDAEYLKKYTDRIKWIRDVCADSGVELILESGQETAADLVKFLHTVPGVGVNFDPANMILYAKGNPVAAIHLLAPWIRHVHIKDACLTKNPGTWGTEVPWGEGEVQPEAFFKALEAAGYKGAFAVEREAGEDRVADIALAVRRCVGA